MIMMMSIDEVKGHPEQWADTSYLRSDNKIEYREKKPYGNRHVIFENGSLWGDVHYDKYNATDIPVGTVNHFSNYVEEKTSIPKGLVALATVGLSLYVGYKAIKWAQKNI